MIHGEIRTKYICTLEHKYTQVYLFTINRWTLRETCEWVETGSQDSTRKRNRARNNERTSLPSRIIQHVVGIFTLREPCAPERQNEKSRFRKEAETRRGGKSTWYDMGRYTSNAIREAIFDKRGNETASRRRSRSIGRWNNSDEITTPCENAFNVGLAETCASFALGWQTRVAFTS